MTKSKSDLDDRLYNYILDKGLRESPALKAARQTTDAHENVRWRMAPEQGQFMALLARLHGTRSYVEVGCFIGYGMLWMAEALPDDAELFSCEISEEFAALARENWERAGFGGRVDLRVLPAIDFLDGLLAERGPDSTDMVFIDADKKPYPDYYDRAIRLVRPGGLIIVDNALWGGSVADPDNQEGSTRAIRQVTTTIQNDDRVDMSLVPVSDGMILARKR